MRQVIEAAGAEAAALRKKRKQVEDAMKLTHATAAREAAAGEGAAIEEAAAAGEEGTVTEQRRARKALKKAAKAAAAELSAVEASAAATDEEKEAARKHLRKCERRARKCDEEAAEALDAAGRSSVPETPPPPAEPRQDRSGTKKKSGLDDVDAAHKMKIEECKEGKWRHSGRIDGALRGTQKAGSSHLQLFSFV